MILYETLEITDAETYANIHGEESRTSCTSIPTPSAVHVVQNISQLLYLLIVTSPEMPHQHAGRQIFFFFFFFFILYYYIITLDTVPKKCVQSQDGNIITSYRLILGAVLE